MGDFKLDPVHHLQSLFGYDAAFDRKLSTKRSPAEPAKKAKRKAAERARRRNRR